MNQKQFFSEDHSLLNQEPHSQSNEFFRSFILARNSNQTIIEKLNISQPAIQSIVNTSYNKKQTKDQETMTVLISTLTKSEQQTKTNNIKSRQEESIKDNLLLNTNPRQVNINSPSFDDNIQIKKDREDSDEKENSNSKSQKSILDKKSLQKSNQLNKQKMSSKFSQESEKQNKGQSNQDILKMLQNLQNKRTKSQLLIRKLQIRFKNGEQLLLKSQQEIQYERNIRNKGILLQKFQKVTKQVEELTQEKIKLIEELKRLKQKVQQTQMPKTQQTLRQDRKFVTPKLEFQSHIRFFSHDLQVIQNFKTYKKQIKQHKIEVQNRNNYLKYKVDQIKKQLKQLDQINSQDYCKFSKLQSNRQLEQLKMKSKILNQQYKLLKKNHRKNRLQQVGLANMEMELSSQGQDR